MGEGGTEGEGHENSLPMWICLVGAWEQRGTGRNHGHTREGGRDRHGRDVHMWEGEGAPRHANAGAGPGKVLGMPEGNTWDAHKGRVIGGRGWKGKVLAC